MSGEVDLRWKRPQFLIETPPGALGEEAASQEFHIASDVPLDAQLIHPSGLNLVKNISVSRHPGLEFTVVTLPLYDEFAGPALLTIFPITDLHGSFTVTGDLGLVPITDPDDGKEIEQDSMVIGSLDYPFDMDVFVLNLTVGDRIHVVASAVTVEPVVMVDNPSVSLKHLGGAGSHGELLKRTSFPYEAKADGPHTVIVRDLQ